MHVEVRRSGALVGLRGRKARRAMWSLCVTATFFQLTINGRDSGHEVRWYTFGI